MSERRQPTLQTKPQVIAPGVRGEKVDLTKMAEEELISSGQQNVEPTLGPKEPEKPKFVSSDQYLENDTLKDEPEQPAIGANRPYAPENSVKAVLAQMKDKLGVKRIPPLDVFVDGLRFTLVKLSDSDSEWAVSNMTENTQHRSESLSSMRTAVVACSVRAIEGIPLYKVMEVEVPKDSRDIERVIENSLYPPLDIRYAAATRFLKQLREELDDNIGPDLYAMYNTKIEEKYTVKVQVDNPFLPEPSEKA